MIRVQANSEQLILPVHVTPKGRRNCLLPFQPDDIEIRLKVTAAPEDGKANAAVIALFSKTLDVPKRDISIVSGETFRHKRLAIRTNASADLLLRLAAALESESQRCFTLG